MAAVVMNKDFAVVFYILVGWNGYHRRPMIEAVARNCEGIGDVVVVEPPVCLPANALRSPCWLWQWWQQPRITKVRANLYILRPWTLMPYRVEKWGFRLGLWRHVLRWEIRTAMRGLGLGHEVTFAYITRPDHHRYIGLASEDQIVYECRDEHSFRDTDGSPAPRTHWAEIRTLQIADHVFATSEALLQKITKLHSNVHLLPNGVDFDLFARARDEKIPLPPDLLAIPRPRIGYTGSISAWFDFKLMTQLAVARPNWLFVLVGWRQGVPKDLESRPNVHFLGWRGYEQLPEYLRGFDVCIHPSVKNRHTDAANPLKIWEYLAAGRKVVSTDLAQVRPLSNVVFVARDKEEFLHYLEVALSSDHQDRVQKGIALAREHSWARVTRKVVDVLAEAASRESGS